MGTSNQHQEITFLANHKTESVYWCKLGNPYKENTCISPWTCEILKIHIYEFPQLKWFYGKGWIVVYKGVFCCIFNDFNFFFCKPALPCIATVYFYSTLINKFAINLFSQLSLLVILNKYWKLNRTGSWRKIVAKIKVLIWRILNLFPNLNRLIFVFDLKRGVSISSFAAAG